MPNAELRSIKMLSGKKFRIPAYQRGYRWTCRQIQDLICDFDSFVEDPSAEKYCLQPVVLEKENGKDYYNVIDGQQRLTSLYLLGAFYRCLNHDDIPHETYTDYTLTFEGKDHFAEFLKKIGECNQEGEIKSKLDQWEQDYSDIDSQNVINILRFLTSKPACRPASKLKRIYEALAKKKEICIIWHELESSGETGSDRAIETFANINANKIPLTDAELIKAVLLQKYGQYRKEQNKDEDLKSKLLITAMNEATFANQWEELERGLNEPTFWNFFVKKPDAYQTRMDILFEIWMADKGIDLSEEDHSLYRAVDEKLKAGINVVEFWREIVNIYETLRDWYENHYDYHMIGAYSLLDKNKGNAGFVQELYKSYKENRTKEEFHKQLKEKLANCYEKMMGERSFKNLTYQDSETKKVLLLFNIALLVNVSKTYQDNKVERFPFAYYKNTSIEVEHINPQHPDSQKSEQEVNDYKANRELILRDNGQEALLSEKNVERLESAAETHTIGNLTLVDKLLNIGFSNGTFQKKRNHVLSAMFDEVAGENKQYKASVLLPGARWVFLRQWKTEEGCPDASALSLDFWSKKERDFYVEKIQAALQKLLGKEVV